MKLRPQSMRNGIFVAGLLGVLLSSHAMELGAKSVRGYDYVFKRPARDCQFILDSDREELVVGVNSKTAPSTNALVRIPEEDIPLKEGYSFRDYRGYEISYSKGILMAKREKLNLESMRKNIKIMELAITPDLKTIKQANVQAYDSQLIRTIPVGELRCEF